MKKLFLHIGFNKTGSTSLQKNLEINAKELQARGVLYPSKRNAPFMQRWQHVPLAAAVPNRNVPWLRERKRDTLGQAWPSLQQYLAAHPHDQLILSSESFGGLDFNIAKVRWVQSQLPDYDITIVAYIRRQDSYFLSTYQEGIKAGWTKPFRFDDYHTTRSLYFADRLRPWKTVFGKNNVIVRPFAPDFWPEGELFFDFCQAIGIDHKGLTLAEPENEGLDYRAVDLLRRLNQLNEAHPVKEDSRRGHLAQLNLIKKLDQILPSDFGKQKMQLSTQQACVLKAYFNDQNTEALEESAISADAFFPEPSGAKDARLHAEAPNGDMLLHMLAHLTRQNKTG